MTACPKVTVFQICCALVGKPFFCWFLQASHHSQLYFALAAEETQLALCFSWNRQIAALMHGERVNTHSFPSQSKCVYVHAWIKKDWLNSWQNLHSLFPRAKHSCKTILSSLVLTKTAFLKSQSTSHTFSVTFTTVLWGRPVLLLPQYTRGQKETKTEI